MSARIKKTVFILVMVLVVASSLVAGTLAAYTKDIDGLAEGSVVAKGFVFTGEGTDSFTEGVKIAPTETVTWHFGVKNYNGVTVTETDLYYKLTFNVAASAGKQAIAPLTVTVKDGSGSVLNTVTGTGTMDVLGVFPEALAGQSANFVVEIFWPSDDSLDIGYAGEGFGTTISVDAAASQLPFDHSEIPEEEEPAADVGVRYETGVPWQNGQGGPYQYQYRVTITNHSDQPIEDWYIQFSLPTDQPTSAWSAKLAGGMPAGSYKFLNPAYNNTATDNILPGQSVSFGGHATGRGTEAIQGVMVGGSNAGAISVAPSCIFNRPLG